MTGGEARARFRFAKYENFISSVFFHICTEGVHFGHTDGKTKYRFYSLHAFKFVTMNVLLNSPNNNNNYCHYYYSIFYFSLFDFGQFKPGFVFNALWIFFFKCRSQRSMYLFNIFQLGQTIVRLHIFLQRNRNSI